MSKYLYILDFGHGGIDPKTGGYTTSGKRSPIREDGTVLYEGVENREKGKFIIKELIKADLDFEVVSHDWQDNSLEDRVNKANKANRIRKTLYISIHSDAFGNGSVWTEPSGISVYTSKGQTRSDLFANVVVRELESELGDTVKWRFDTSDGDKDKEADFYVLKNTNSPAVLLELGFHTNKIEAARMQTVAWKEMVAKAIVQACLKWEKM